VGSRRASSSTPKNPVSFPSHNDRRAHPNIDTRLDNFLPYNVAAGFFLNIPRFINSYVLYASEDNSRPSQALLSTVYLWGIKVSRSEQLTSHESVFLARAIRNISSALASDHPQKGKHAVQAEILLTHYLFCNGRYLEGRYHSNAAVSIAISFGFHRIRSTQGPLSSTATVDPIEEGEMINAFWTAYMVEQCWSTALNVPFTLLDTNGANGRIDSPWPLDPVQYEKVCLFQITPDIQLRYVRRDY
jgi:Fungal specific transcription factor domain